MEISVADVVFGLLGLAAMLIGLWVPRRAVGAGALRLGRWLLDVGAAFVAAYGASFLYIAASGGGDRWTTEQYGLGILASAAAVLVFKRWLRSRRVRVDETLAALASWAGTAAKGSGTGLLRRPRSRGSMPCGMG